MLNIINTKMIKLLFFAAMNPINFSSICLLLRFTIVIPFTLNNQSYVLIIEILKIDILFTW